MRRRIFIRGCVRSSVGPSVRMSRVIFEGEKNAYLAHLVPCIRPCFPHSFVAFLATFSHFLRGCVSLSVRHTLFGPNLNKIAFSGAFKLLIPPGLLRESGAFCVPTKFLWILRSTSRSSFPTLITSNPAATSWRSCCRRGKERKIGP